MGLGWITWHRRHTNILTLTTGHYADDDEVDHNDEDDADDDEGDHNDEDEDQKLSNGKDNFRSDEHNNGATARNYQTAVKIQTIDSIFPL